MASEWVWDGGRPCLDLINTMRDRKTGPRELIDEPDDLAHWLAAAGLLDGPVAVSAAHVERALGLREAVDRLVLGEVRESDVELVNELAGVRQAARWLAIDDRGHVVVETAAADDPVTVALGSVAADLVALLVDRPAIKICASADCGVRFEDRSPAGNRQWCSMSRCGNREKARQHYRRRTR